MDGYHVAVTLPLNMQGTCWNRKGETTMNNLVSVDFNINITVQLVGWGGYCHDARMLLNAHERGFWWDPGNFYYLMLAFICSLTF